MASMTITKTLSSELSFLREKVQASMDSAKNSCGINPQFETARKVAIVIENMRNVYGDDLSWSLDKLREPVIKHLKYLSSIIETLGKSWSILNDIENPCTTLLDSLPLAHWQPKLTGVTPRYLCKVEPDFKSSDFKKVEFTGHFPVGLGPDFLPSLSLKDDYKTIQGTFVSKTPTSLTFNVPISQLSDTFKFVESVLKVPFEAGTLRSNKKEFAYRITLGALPGSPGKITTYSICPKQPSKVVPFRSKIYHASADDVYQEKSLLRKVITKTFIVNPDSGHSIIPESVKLCVGRIRNIGGHTETLRIFSDRVEVIVALTAGEKNSSSAVDFSVHFDETPDKQEEQKEFSEILDPPLLWGKTKRISPPRDCKISRIVFEAYDGSISEFRNDFNHPYLNLTRVPSGGFDITANPPSE